MVEKAEVTLTVNEMCIIIDNAMKELDARRRDKNS